MSAPSRKNQETSRAQVSTAREALTDPGCPTAALDRALRDLAAPVPLERRGATADAAVVVKTTERMPVPSAVARGSSSERGDDNVRRPTTPPRRIAAMVGVSIVAAASMVVALRYAERRTPPNADVRPTIAPPAASNAPAHPEPPDILTSSAELDPPKAVSMPIATATARATPIASFPSRQASAVTVTAAGSAPEASASASAPPSTPSSAPTSEYNYLLLEKKK